MSGQDVALHPRMTLQQIAAWCAVHRCEAHISWCVVKNELWPLVKARPVVAEDNDTRLSIEWWNSLTLAERDAALLAAHSSSFIQAWHHCRLQRQMFAWRS
jgi:hypothetical protein